MANKTTLRVIKHHVGDFAIGDTFVAEDYGTDVAALVKAEMVEIVPDDALVDKASAPAKSK